MLFNIEGKEIFSFEEMDAFGQKYKENSNYELIANILYKNEAGTVEKGKEEEYSNFKQLKYSQLWQLRQDYEKAGWSKEEKDLKALIFVCDYKSSLPIKKSKWAKFCYGFFSDMYMDRNILSVSSIKIKDKECCCVFIFPLNPKTRQFSSNLVAGHKTFISIKDKRKLNPDVEESFRFAVENQIGKFHDAEETEQINKIKLLQQEWPELNREYEGPIISNRKEEDNEEKFYTTALQEEKVKTTLSRPKFEKLQSETLYYFTEGVEKASCRQAYRGEIEVETVISMIETYLLNREPELSNIDKELIVNNTLNAIYGYYRLTPLIEDDAISDIRIISWDHIRVKVSGNRFTSNIKFESEEDYINFVRRAAEKNRIDLRTRPESIFSDVISSPSCRMRFDIQTKDITSNTFPNLHIRKIPKKKKSLDELIKLEMMPRKIAQYLVNKVKDASGILFCGKGASGKSTILSALIDYIPKNASGVIIQESEELFTEEHPDLLFQHVLLKEQSPTGTEIGLKELTRNALVSDEDYIIIGEVKGGECLYALNACATGAKFMCTIHSSSSQDAIGKMVDYIQYDSKYSREDAEYMLKDINVVVFMKNFKVEEISEVVGWDFEQKKLKYKTMYYRDVDKFLKKKSAGIIQ